ncbi:MAG: hypothetical protein ACTSWC_00880 [Promethearchaeota archaeon]
MPYCNGCGLYYNYVDQRKLCRECSIQLTQHDLDEKRIFSQRKMMRQHSDFKLLYYPVKFQTIPRRTFQNIPSEPSSEPSFNSPLISSSQYSQRDNSPLDQFAPPDRPQSPFTMMYNNRVNISRSKIALVSAVIGILITFIQFLSFFGLFLEIFALVSAIKSIRTETRNWMNILTIIISLGYLILLVIGVVMILSDPNLLAAMEAAINESTALGYDFR